MTSSGSLGERLGLQVAPGAASTSTFHFTVDSFSAQPTTLLPHSHTGTGAGRTQLRTTKKGRGTDSAGTRTPGAGAVITSNSNTTSNTNQLPGPGSNLDTYNNLTTATTTTFPQPAPGNGSGSFDKGISLQTAIESNVHHSHRQHHNSSKLPAFRFADLKKNASSFFPSLPLLQPSPNKKSRRGHCPGAVISSTPAGDPAQLLSPDNLQLAAPASPPQFNQQHEPKDPKQPQPTSPFNHNPPDNRRPQLSSRTAEEEEERSTPTTAAATPLPRQQIHKRRLQVEDSPAIRASTSKVQPFSPTAAKVSSIGSKRPASSVCDSQSATARGPYVSSRYRSASIVTPLRKRRQTNSVVLLLPSIDSITAQGPREQVPPATKSRKINEKRRYRPPASSSSKPAFVLTASGSSSGGQANNSSTRQLRSSTSSDSLLLDCDYNFGRTSDCEGDMSNSTQRDRALRALEGRRDDDMSRMTPPDSATAASDNENTAEIFMNIAREDPAPRPAQTRNEDQSAISRINRTSSHRRPLSTAIPSYQTSSPPQVSSRRLSDSREMTASRSRLLSDPQTAREPQVRGIANRLNTSVPQEDLGRSQSVRTSLRQNPPTPRTIAFQDAYEAGAGLSRRSSMAEISSVGRNQPYRNSNLGAVGGRIYNSSPLVPRAPEPQRQEPPQNTETNQGAEGTDSSTSTADPSTVWDELDDLKSRIHRLELTGKKPPASNSRSSEERPPTATTNATTMSASPKRGSGGTTINHGETASNASSKETQPILLSALSKTKGLISAEVFNAIESAANDALALTSMIGAAGQPGPISSGASVVGGYGSGVTDRQLRRKADSICRSLTELCIALTDEANQPKSAQPAAPSRETEKVITPTTANKFSGITGQRRSSIIAETALPQPTSATSPRAPTTMEQRRISLLAASALPSPRNSAIPATPVDFGTPGRKSSLLLARNRRMAVEEPEDQVNGRRSSLLLRSRRVGQQEDQQQEEPMYNAEGRKTSLLLRSRTKVFNEEDEDRYRTPSRAITEVNGLRSAPREFTAGGGQTSSPPDNTPLGSSALPRRRLVPTSISSRLSTPTAPALQPSASRRYLDRTGDGQRETVVASSYAERLAEERAQRQLSLGQTAMMNRTGSISRRTRGDSGIPSISTSNLQQQQQQQQQVGGYR
ncbi:hypothetical protein B0T20DRAFT_163790 [Sordaria brevicollis]|uniref:LPXTG-motif cell wall anchor domain protein n=1 Tax=Sordaria brevicollis TaxID=83679 RepID=A0AAE0PJM1_SORBR|nr:hypothetical protein B0T20DRAFT_163790 [Sordaria brevicollis]